MSVLTITCNPALDITYKISHLLPYTVHRVSRVDTRPGGKGVNVASVLTELGTPVTVSGFLGGESGKTLAELIPPTIHQSWVSTTVPTRATTAIVDDHGATLFNEPGPEVGSPAWDSLISHVAEIAHGFRVIAISGSVPTGASITQFERLVRAASSSGVPVIVDTSGPYLLGAAQAKPFLLKPNKEELLEATGANTVDAGVATLLERGAQAIMLSDGEKGLGLFSSRFPHTRQSLWARPGEVIHGNATGAGDSVVASIAHDLAQGHDTEWPTMLRNAVAVAGAAVAAPLAGHIDKETLNRLHPLTTIHSL